VQGRVRRGEDDGGGGPPYRGGMEAGARSPVWVSALAIGAFQLVGTFGAAHNQTDRRGIGTVAVLLVLAGPAVLAVRDRYPLVAVAVAIAATDMYIGLGYPYGPIFVSAVVALFSAVRAGRRQATWVLAGIGYAGFVVAYLADPRGRGPTWLHLALVAGWLAVALAIADVVRGRREQMMVRMRAARAERERRAGEQRLQLAQELHDVLAHNISLINVQASVALHLLDEQPDQARPALTAIKTASHDALHELRTALDLLRRDDRDPQAAPRAPAPRLADLDALVTGVRAGGLTVNLERDPTAAPLPGAIELAAFRIVQEALTNVVRHARARTVTVRVDRGDDELNVEVVDDGVGGEAATGNGISGMRERAAALGGVVAAGPAPNGGFQVVARLPVRS